MARWKSAHPLCLGCQAVGRISATEVTDHIIPVECAPDRRADPANWQPACRDHHDIVKQRLDARYKAGQLPASELRLDSATAVALTQELLLTR
jgi:5-methylcytosine-specific restriction protein A